jgi:hypothetical protein
MRLSRYFWYALSVVAVALMCFGAWYAFQTIGPAVPVQPISRGATEAALKRCIGQTAKEVVLLLELSDAKWYWTDEPPGVLRGVSYAPANERSVTLYIAKDEALFRRFEERREWDYEAFLGCRIGGIQYKAGEVRLDIGPDVPFQFRRP